MIASGASLQLDRARVAGAMASRALLAGGLAHVPMTQLGLGDDELLLIPRHRSQAVLRARADGGVDPGFGGILANELAKALATAAIDPLPGMRAAAYRFTSRQRFAIWLLGSWLKGGASAQLLPDAVRAAYLPGGSPLGWARRNLFDDGRTLPPVFAALAQHGLAAALMARLDTADVARMTAALQQSHALTLAAPDARRWSVTASTASTTPLVFTTSATGSETAVVRRQIDVIAATARLAGNDLTRLPVATVALMLVLLCLEDDPAVSRAALTAAVAAGAEAALAINPPAAVPPVKAPDPVATITRAEVRPTPDLSVTQPSIAFASRIDGLVPDTEVAIASDFAGLFFLLNAFLAMGLYPDFTRPADHGLALAPTRLLDRVALQHFGRRYRNDRLHRALAPARKDPSLPDRWQVGPDWLDAFPEHAMGLTAKTSRYRTQWHPAGFPLADVPSRARDARLWPQSARRVHHARLPSARQARWLGCLALYLDARIRRATDDPAIGLDSLAIPGRCRIGPQRIDVDLALADLPLPLRLAGLDRDPGWLPAEGRSIALHFQ